MEYFKPMNMTVRDDQLEDFKTACGLVMGIEFIRHDSDENNAYVTFRYAHNLFYLGYLFHLELNSVKKTKKQLQTNR